MKLRYDFVTNSSSTSFVIISDGEFNLKDFIEAVGVKADARFADIYKHLFKAFKNDMQPARDFFASYRKNGYYSSFEDLIEKNYKSDVLKKIIEAESAGKLVYVGELTSDHDEIESFFCTDSFIIENEKLFIDARENAW